MIQIHTVPIVAQPQWHDVIKPGLEVAIAEAHDETTIENTFNLLSSGRAHLWIVLKDNKYAGFYITELMQTAKSFWVYVTFGYSVPEHRCREMLMRAFSEFETFARSLSGCAGVRMFSSVPNFKVLTSEKMGYKTRFIEYVKEI